MQPTEPNTSRASDAPAVVVRWLSVWDGVPKIPGYARKPHPSEFAETPESMTAAGLSHEPFIVARVPADLDARIAALEDAIMELRLAAGSLKAASDNSTSGTGHAMLRHSSDKRRRSAKVLDTFLADLRAVRAAVAPEIHVTFAHDETIPLLRVTATPDEVGGNTP
jgi:hypothetical protein